MFMEECKSHDTAKESGSWHYRRINPAMTTVPSLDSPECLDALRTLTVQGIPKEVIRDLALQLVASTFYYKKFACGRQNGTGGYDCRGMKA